jgi:photosystem II stability/assembly factor-like uncharacterized protein
LAARRAIFGLLLGILVAAPLRGGVNRWTSNTPPWGPEVVRGVAVHPRIPGVVFARGDGLWRSDDAGASWRRLAVPQRLVLTVAPDPSSADVVYVDRTGGGVLRSADGGRTWAPVADDATSPPVVSQLTIAPSAPDTLFAYGIGRAGAGLYRSRNAGTTWQMALASSAFVGIAIDPSDARNVHVAAADQGVLRSSDGGDHWVPSNTGLLVLSATSIAIDAEDARRLYLINAGQIYRSTDAGGTWLPVFGIANSVEVSSDPLQANVAYVRTGPTVGFDGLLRTTDGGFTWRAISPPPGVTRLNGLAPDPGHSDGLFVVTDLVLKTSDAGTTWSTLGEGPAEVGARGLAVSPFEAATVYAAGGLARFSLSTDSGGLWLAPGNAGFPSGSTNNLAVAATTPETVYAGTSSGLFRTLNRGATWSRVGPFTDSTRILLGAEPDAMLIAVTTAGSSRSTDGGATWHAISSSGGGPVFATLLAETVPPTLLATADFGLAFLRGNAAGPLVSVPGAPILTLLVADPLEPPVIYGVGSVPGDSVRRFFRSNDAGSTWSPVGTLPAATILTLAIDPFEPTHAAIGTDSGGVFRSTDGGASWEPFSEGLLEATIVSISFSTDGRTLYAGTEHAVYQYTFCDEGCRPVNLRRPPTRVVGPRP